MPQRVVTINILLLLRFASDERQKYIGLVNLIEGSAKPINIIIMLQQSRCYSGLPLMGSLTPICFNLISHNTKKILMDNDPPSKPQSSLATIFDEKMQRSYGHLTH